MYRGINLGDISPVLASFLAGQQTAAGTIDKAKDAALKKQQFDQMIKQFDAEMKMRDAEYKLHQQQVDLTRKQHVEKLKQDLSKQWAENPATAPGSKQFTMSIPGLQDLPSNTLSPVPGTMVEAPSEFGPLQVMMPKSENQLALEKANAAIPAQVDLFNKTQGALQRDLETSRESARSKDLEAKLAAQAKEFADKMDWQDKWKDLQLKNERELAGIKADAAVRKQLFDMGMSGGDNFAESIMAHVKDQATGKEDPSAIKGTPLHNFVEAAKRKLGVVDLPGGPKTRQAVLALGDEGALLLNKFRELNSAYPPSDNTAGRVGQTIMGLTTFTDIGKKYKEFESNLMNYAKTTAGITSSRLLDSNKEQTRFMGSLPSTKDSSVSRNDKQVNLIENVFTHIDSAISGLSVDQKKDFWKDIITNNPTFLNLAKEDSRYVGVFKKIHDSGNFDSSWMNPLRENKRAR